MILQGVCYYFSLISINWVGFRVVIDLRSEAFAKLQELELGYFSQQKAGDLISRISNDTVASATRGLRLFGRYAGARAFCSYWVRWAPSCGNLQSLNADKRQLVAHGPTALPRNPVVILGRKVKKYSKQNQERLAGVLSILEENIGGARIVRAFGMEQYELDKFEEENQRRI